MAKKNTAVDLASKPRTLTGKGAAGRMRKDGRVPAVAYGHEIDPTPISVDALELYHALHTDAGTNVMIKLDIDGEDHLAVTREIQRHKVRGDVMHVDFVAVDKESKISVEIPIHIQGAEEVTPGVVNQVLSGLPVLVKPLEVPNSFDIDVSEMEIGDVMRCGEVPLPDGVTIDIDAERTLITINAPSKVEEPETETDEEGEEGAEGEAGEGEAAEGGEGAAAEGGDEG